MKTKLVIFAILMAAGLSAASAQTVTFAVDFGANGSNSAIYSGTFGGTTADEWSGLNAPGLFAQTADSSITLSNVTLTFPGGFYSAYDNDSHGTDDPADALLGDFFFASGGGTSNFTISGLQANQTLTLSFVGGLQPWTSLVTFGGNTVTVPGLASGTSSFTQIAGVDGSVSSSFSGSWTGVSGNEGDLAGAEITITTVPEPSTYAMLGFGLCGLVALRFRRRHVA